MAESIDDRALNRATLARQLLLERSTIAPLDAIGHLVGLQAQNPLDPYLALWSRLAAFDPAVVGRALEQRQLVRIVVMRGTIHLLGADDARWVRPVTQPVMDAEIARHSEFAHLLVGVDMAPVLEFAAPLLAGTPLPAKGLRAALATRFPDLDAPALAYACRCLLPLVQIPPRGVWGRTLQVTSTPLEDWTGEPLDRSRTIDDLVLRYLAAYGPASVADATTFTRLTGLREVLERLRPTLRSFAGPTGTELFDLPEAPRPSSDVPAPVRLLPEYDNVLLSHANRSRFSAAASRPLGAAVGPVKGTALVDGEVRAVWHPEQISGAKGPTRLVVEHGPLSASETDELEAEAARLLEFRHGAGEHRVELRPIA